MSHTLSTYNDTALITSQSSYQPIAVSSNQTFMEGQTA